jgi:2-oxo-4-hydroxy-4-carboxy-5-ureidoimidazoline decarboxylase
MAHPMMIPLDKVNGLPLNEFIALFGDVAEHSPWVAAAAVLKRPFATREAMIEAFAAAVREAGETQQLQLIRAHPDLATRAKLTDDSHREQQGAGLDTLTPEEFQRFTTLNDAYRKRFDIPFIFAVKGADKHQILAAFEARLGNARTTERETAVTQVCRIFRFRLEDRVQA